MKDAKTQAITNPAVAAIHAIGKSLTELAKDSKTYDEVTRKGLQAEAVRVHRLAEKVKRGVERDGKKAERLAKMQELLKKLNERLQALEAE